MRIPPPGGPRACWPAALALAAPPLLSLWYIHEYAVNAAHWDHLITAELFDRFYTGALTLEYLFRPHLEHLKPVPRLVSLGLGLATRFDNVAEMYLQWLLLCAAAAVLFGALRRRTALAGCALAAAFVPVALAMFTLRQHESMLVGDGLITYLSIAAVVSSVCVLEDARSARAVGAACALAVAGSLSHAGALLVWPIGAAILALPWTGVAAGRLRRRALGAWIAAAAAIVLIYAWRVPAGLGGALAAPTESLRYVLAAAGVTFAAQPRAQLRFGAVAWLLELLVAWLSLRHVRSTRRIPLGLWLLAFAAGMRLLTAAGRGAAGYDLFVPSRYAAFMALATAGAWLAAVETRARARASGLAAPAAALLLVAGTVWYGYREGWLAGPAERDMRLRIRQVLETTPLQDDGPIQELLYPNPHHARAYAAALERYRLNVFAEPQVDPASLPRSGGARVHVDALNGKPVTASDAVPVGPAQTIHVAGWAFERARHAPFDRAFVTIDGRTTLPAAYGLYRPDVAREVGNGLPEETGFEARFSTKWLAPGEHTIALQFVTKDRVRAIVTEPVAAILIR